MPDTALLMYFKVYQKRQSYNVLHLQDMLYLIY